MSIFKISLIIQVVTNKCQAKQKKIARKETMDVLLYFI